MNLIKTKRYTYNKLNRMFIHILIGIKKIDAKETTFVDACDVSGIKCKTADSKSGISDGAVIGIIFGVIVLGFGGLVVLSRKK